MTQSSRRDRWSTAILVAAAAILVLVAPIEACLTLAVVAVVVLVGGYVSVGALTGAVIAPALIAIGIGAPSRAFAVGVVIGIVVIVSQRGHMRRLRAGEEPQLGKFFTRSIPGAKPGVGLFATPAPHGLLGRSAMTPGAVFIILLSVLLAALVAGASR